MERILDTIRSFQIAIEDSNNELLILEFITPLRPERQPNGNIDFYRDLPQDVQRAFIREMDFARFDGKPYVNDKLAAVSVPNYIYEELQRINWSYGKGEIDGYIAKAIAGGISGTVRLQLQFGYSFAKFKVQNGYLVFRSRTTKLPPACTSDTFGVTRA